MKRGLFIVCKASLVFQAMLKNNQNLQNKENNKRLYPQPLNLHNIHEPRYINSHAITPIWLLPIVELIQVCATADSV